MNKPKFFLTTLSSLLILSIVGCSDSHKNQTSSPDVFNSEPVGKETESKDALKNPTSSTNQVNSDSLWGISESQPPKSSGRSVTTTVATNNAQSEQQRSATTTLASNTPPTTGLPRFLSFGCAVRARDYDNPAPVGSKALEIRVDTSGPTTGGAWLETTSHNFRRRSAIKLDTNGDGRTVHFVPDGTTTEVNVYASYTFEPSSMMCRTSN